VVEVVVVPLIGGEILDERDSHFIPRRRRWYEMPSRTVISTANNAIPPRRI
jgi:hypothetical protein